MICIRDDEYVRERLRWVVELDDGTTVYEDDDRPGVEPPQAWLRLRQHCAEAGRWIVRMWLQHRSHRVQVEPPDAAGYFLVKQAFGVWGDPQSYTAVIAGVLGEDGLVHATRWKTPELYALEHEVRDVHSSSVSLIARPGAFSVKG